MFDIQLKDCCEATVLDGLESREMTWQTDWRLAMFDIKLNDC